MKCVFSWLSGLALNGWPDNQHAIFSVFSVPFSVPSQAGTYTLVASGTNQNGPFSATSTVTVTNATPTFSVSSTQASVTQGSAYSVTMGLSDPNPNDGAATYTVSWGDGQSDTGTGPVFTHTFLKPTLGTDHVTATALAAGYTLTATTAVSVLNFTPTFTVSGGTGDAESGVPATLTASLTDPTGSSVSYSVDFGDGTSGPAYGPNPTHAFVFNPDANGNDSSTYTMTAQAGGTSYVTTGIEQIYMAGSGQITVTDGGSINESGTFWLTNSFYDSQQTDAQRLQGPSWVVSWGDGTTTTSDHSQTTYATAHIYGEAGTYNIEVDAIYQEGDVYTYYRESVTHDTAVVGSGQPTSFAAFVTHLAYGNSVTAAPVLNDADGDSPVYTVAWGDGASSTGKGPAFTHTYAYSTQTISYAVSVSATDDDGTFQADGGTASWVTILPNFSTVSITGGGIAYEHNQQPADFILSRTGGDLTQPLTVNLGWGGSEDPSEYEAIDRTTGHVIGGSVTFLANQYSKDIEVIPLEDNTPEWTDTILATLQASGNYAVNPTYSTATISVADGDLGVTLGNGSGNIILEGSSDGNENTIGLTLDAPSNPPEGAAVTLTETGPADVWDGATQIMGKMSDGSVVQSYTWQGTSPPNSLEVGATEGSTTLGNISFGLSDSDLNATPAGATTNLVATKPATSVMAHIYLLDDPNNSGFVNKDVANQTLNWLPGQIVDLKATVVAPPSLAGGLLVPQQGWNVPGAVLYNYQDSDAGATQTPLLADNIAGANRLFWQVGTAQREIQFFWTGNDPYVDSALEQVRFSISGPALGTLSIATTFKVFEPSSSLVVTSQGTTQVFGTYPKQLIALVTSLSPPPGSNGIELSANAEKPSGVTSLDGSWEMVQLFGGYRTRTVYTGGAGTATLQFYSGSTSINGLTVLDGSDPYPLVGPGSGFRPKIFSTASGPEPMYDSPGVEVNASVEEAQVNQPFTDYLMFLPPGDDSRWVPLQTLGWKWTMIATDTGGTFTVFGTGPAPTGAAPSNSEPTWSTTARPKSFSYR